MTLEDFFTLTEMKDGLTARASVEELVSVMKKEKDSLLKNVGDATRQWAAVARTIAATENKECLDLFVQLDGLWFIDRWLKNAQTFATEGSDCFVEEAISALLQAVAKLHVDNERLTSSGICDTVKSLLSCRNTRVQDGARTLLDNWKATNAGCLSTGAEKAEVYGDSTLNNDELAKSQTAADDTSPIRCLDDQKLKCAEREMIRVSNVQDSSQISSDHVDSKDGCPDTIASPVKLKCGEGDISVMEDVCPSDRKLDPRSPSDPKQVNIEVKYEALKSEHVADLKDDRIESVQDRLGKVEVSSDSDIANVLSENDYMGSKEAAVKPNSDTNDAKDDLTIETVSCKDTNQLGGESINGMDSVVMEQKSSDQGCSAVNESKDQGTTISGMEDIGRYGEAKKRHKSSRKYFGNTCEFTRLTKSSKNTDFIRQTDMDLEDGTVDALDFARLVAKEIEREVVGYDEQSGSSSSDDERISEGSIRQPDSPEPINGGLELHTNGQADELPTVENVTPEASEKEHLINSAIQDSKLEKHIQDMESSQVTGALHELDANTQKNICEFDLNQEFSSEDLYHQVDTVSNPVSVVSASKAAPPGIPASCVRFEKTLSDGGTSSGSRQRQDLVDFDLNVAEGGDDKTIEPVSGKQMTMLPGLLSGESSVELSPKRSEKIGFDLNQIGEDADLPASDWKMDGRILGQPQNCRRSPSPASSSSCLQPSMRNFDLNDNPSSCNSVVDHQPFLGDSSSHKTSSCMGPPDDSVISILGTKIKKNTSQTLTPFPNGSAEPLMDTSLLRGAFVGLEPSVPYAQSLYGYNGLAMGPVVSFPPGPTYGPGGPIPYLFVSRGAPVMPHVIGSAPTVTASHCQPSLIMNMVGTTPGSNGVGALRPNLDLNSGFAVEGGNRDSGFFRPLFIPGRHGRPLDEQQLRDNLRTFNSGSSGVKRKEPETGWEFYPTNYKHHQPPHL